MVLYRRLQLRILQYLLELSNGYIFRDRSDFKRNGCSLGSIIFPIHKEQQTVRSSSREVKQRILTWFVQEKLISKTYSIVSGLLLQKVQSISFQI
jgi:hypothetical protein